MKQAILLQQLILAKQWQKHMMTGEELGLFL
jgi:hypothetical protein